ncbi:beta strand repeat-containing protein [Cellulomonas sp. ICMP 17802]|uniref:beta strand repeat-containing protein n=1 Tax=Cellulomonas sp. ICMP 17802 TaxID=3239199 RepID=UPI00351B0EBF
MRFLTFPRRSAALAVATVLALGAGLTAGALPAAAADPVGFTVDDFAGHAMGTRSVPPTSDFTCEPSQGSAVTVSGGQMRVTMPGRGSAGNSACGIANTWVEWSPALPVDITNGGTVDRIVMKYQDIAPQVDGNPISFGIQVEDSSGRRGTAAGLARGKEDNFLSVRYTPEYPGDVTWLAPGWQQPSVDLTQIVRLRLTIGATLQNTTTAVTFTSLGFVMNEPAYEMPAIPAAGPWVFPASTATSTTLDVTGFPEPTVTVSGAPAWLTASSVKGSHQSRLTLSGNPGTAYVDTTVHVHAVVADGLVADRDVRLVVPSPVTFSPAAAPTTTVGAAGPLALGTVVSTPVAAATATTGLPPGTSLQVVGGALQLTGTPTTGGTYSVSTTLDTGFVQRPVTVPVVVQAPPTVAHTADLALVKDVAMTPVDVAVGGYPAPAVVVTGLPAGLSATRTATGVQVSGIPSADGSSSVTVTAASSAGTASDGFAVLVGEPAALAALPAATLEAGTAARIPLVLTGSPTPTVTATGLPAGLSVVVDGGGTAIAGTPTRAAAGTGTAHLVPTNALGAGTGVDLAWTVEAAPLLTGPTAVDAHVGTPLTQAYAASGYPTPTVTLQVLAGGTLAALPAGVTVDSSTPGTLVLTGTPTQAGTTLVRITAANGVGADVTRDVTLTSLLAPSFTDPTPSLVVRAGVPASLTLQVAGHPAPTLTVTGLPAWLTFDPSTGTFSGTPAASDAGDAGPVTVTATNSSGSAAAVLSVRVTTPPALSVGDPAGHAVAGVALPGTFVGTVSGFPLPTVTATGLPAGLSLTVAPDGAVRLTGTPTGPGGPFVAHLTATNGVGAADTANVAWEVWTVPTLSGPSTVTLPVGASATIPFTLTGYPAPTMVATPALPAGLSIVGGSVVGTPTAPGTTALQLTATSWASSAPLAVTVVVTSEPAFAPAPTTTHVRLGSAVDLPAFGTVGYPAPTVTIGSLPAGLAAVADGTGFRLVGTPTATGTTTVPVSLASSAGTASVGWQILVEEPASVSAPASVGTPVGAAIAPVVVTAGGYPRPTLVASGLPAGLSLMDGGTGWTIVGTPTVAGRSTVTLTADNGIGAAASTTVQLDVLSAPTLGQASYDATFAAGQTSTLMVTADGHEAPVLSVGMLPAWLTFDPATGTFTGSPSAADEGVAAPVTVTATNASGTDTAPVTITVTTTAATTDTGGTTTVLSGATVDEPLTTVTGYPVPVVTATGLPAGLTLVQSGRDLHLVGSSTVTGAHAVTLDVHNGTGPAVTVGWTVRVVSPATVAATGRVEVVRGSALSVPVTASGFPAPVVTAAGLPAGVTWVPAAGGGRLVGTPLVAGTSRVTLTATNGVGAAATTDVLVVVGLPTVHVALSAGTVAVGGTLAVTVDGLGAGETVDVELHSTPQLLARATADATGAVRLTVRVPAGTPVGSHTIVVVGSSGASGSAAVRVVAAASPALAATGSGATDLGLLGLVLVLGGAAAVGARARRRDV